MEKLQTLITKHKQLHALWSQLSKGELAELSPSEVRKQHDALEKKLQAHGVVPKTPLPKLATVRYDDVSKIQEKIPVAKSLEDHLKASGIEYETINPEPKPPASPAEPIPPDGTHGEQPPKEGDESPPDTSPSSSPNVAETPPETIPDTSTAQIVPTEGKTVDVKSQPQQPCTKEAKQKNVEMSLPVYDVHVENAQITGTILAEGVWQGHDPEGHPLPPLYYSADVIRNSPFHQLIGASLNLEHMGGKDGTIDNVWLDDSEIKFTGHTESKDADKLLEKGCGASYEGTIIVDEARGMVVGITEFKPTVAMTETPACRLCAIKPAA